MIWITLIKNNIPTLFAREVLKIFCEIFEDSYNREIIDLYSHFKGDISIFRKESKSRQSIEGLIEDVFHLYLNLPFKIGSSKGKKLSPKSKKIIQFAKDLIHKTKDYIYLEKLFNEVSRSLTFNNEDPADLIFDLVNTKILLPVSLENGKKKLIVHF